MPTELDLITRWDANAPRYTSFPTAAAFRSAVGAHDWAMALGGLEADESASLYVHIPFCKRLCWYCGCNTRAVNRRETISSYVDLLLREADLVAQEAGGRSGSPDSIWGVARRTCCRPWSWSVSSPGCAAALTSAG